ncbi:glycosyltransferase, partial [Oceanobacillus bengalensis]
FYLCNLLTFWLQYSVLLLCIKQGVARDKISITGIPVHPVFKEQKTNCIKKKDKWTFLISGGNMGAGSMKQFIDCLQPSGSVVYKVLCGKNKHLFHSIDQLNHPYIKALPYLHSKEEMNQLYVEADAMITKPGGVTISECIWRKIPTIVYEALPGQEEFNLNYLIERGLVFYLKKWESHTNIESIMLDMFHEHSATLNERLNEYHHDMEDHDIISVLKELY